MKGLLNASYISRLIAKANAVPISWRMLAVVSITSIVIFAGFAALSSHEDKKLVQVITSKIRNERLTSGAYDVAKQVTDLETLGLIQCARLFEVSGNGRIKYYDSKQAHCAHFNQANLISAPLVTTNGLKFEIEFVKPDNSVLLAFEFFAYLALGMLSLGMVREIAHQRKLRELELRSELSKDRAIARSEAELAKQIAHDIRSPLAALNMVISLSDSLAENQRVMIRSSVQRINEIANGLLQRRDPHAAEFPTDRRQGSQRIMLIALIDSVISEKRAEYRRRIDITIQNDLSTGYGLFVTADPIELSRVISNLVNNSVEALPKGGELKIMVASVEEENVVVVRDNGRGIPADLLPRLGTRELSSESAEIAIGNGLGLMHARETIDALGGRLQIESMVDVGTSVSIRLPKASAPSWFVNKIVLEPDATIVTVDDDQSIHQIWAERISKSSSTRTNINQISIYNPAQLQTWITDNVGSRDALYLIDHEFIDDARTGVSTIAELGIKARSILVTSHYEDSEVLEKASKLGIRMIPKGLAAFVPIEINVAKRKPDAILIDDDDLVHLTWKMAAERSDKSLECYFECELFLVNLENLDRSSPVYIDVDLKNGIRGQDVAIRLHDLGFTQIYLATGFDPSAIDCPSFVKSVLGKDPVF